MVYVRGIRGATTLDRDTKEEIISKTKELLVRMKELNDTEGAEVASIFFTMTPDCHACFPAEAARELGWNDIPLICGQELQIDGAMQKVVRVLIHINTDKKREEIKHVYLHGTEKLREDIDHNN
jgi:chorismate mutase